MFRAFVLFLTIGVLYVQAEVELYSDQYDYIDPVAILNNDALREQYYDCFMDTGPCVTPDAVFFKGNLPEAIVTKCQRCTVKQQQMFDTIVDWYTANQEQKWTALIAKLIEDAKRMKIEGARK